MELVLHCAGFDNFESQFVSLVFPGNALLKGWPDRPLCTSNAALLIVS